MAARLAILKPVQLKLIFPQAPRYHFQKDRLKSGDMT